MNIRRHKKVQRHLRFYYNNYGFYQPYQVLIDGTFCFAAMKEQINIREQLPKYLHGTVKMLTTRCVLKETELIAKKATGALTVLKQFGVHECGHKEPFLGSECILSMVGKNNEKHYIIATQDRDLQEKIRLKAGVPLLYLHNKSPNLDKPSKASYAKVGSSVDGNIAFISKTQNETLKNMKKALGIEETVEQQKVIFKKKKTKNPNPLSCKKKKKSPGKKDNGKKENRVIDGKVSKRRKPKLTTNISNSEAK